MKEMETWSLGIGQKRRGAKSTMEEASEMKRQKIEKRTERASRNEQREP